MSTLNVGWALSKGNDFPVSVTLSSDHGAVITGRTVTAAIAAAQGGAPIVTPAATITLTEDTASPATARRYSSAFDASVVGGLLDLALAEYWLSVQVEGDALVWERVLVIPYRRAS